MSLFPEYTTVNNDVQQEEFYEIIWPISAPGVALPGPDFAAYAEALEPDQSVVIKGSGNKAKLISYPDVLQELYERSLFEPRFTLPVKNKGVEYQAEFLPGHIWDNRPPELDNEAPTDIASLGEDQTLKLLYGPPEEGCDVMVVGKMPGYEDVANGVNMYGPIGKLFKDALDSLGVVDSGDWYITNLIKFAKVDSRTDAIPQSFIKDCLPTLQLEMRLVKPKYMLLLGAEAVTWVLGKGQKLANTVGEVFEHTIDLRKDSTEAENTHTIKVMTCSNPGRVLRSPDLRPQFVEELRMFTELLKGKEVGRAEKDLEHHIVSDETTLEALVSRILKEPYNNVIAVDAEWHGEHPFEPGAYPRSIQFSHKGKFAMCVVLNAAGGTPAFKNKQGQVDIKSALPHLKRLCKSSAARPVRIVGHFFRADLPWLEYFGLNLKDEFEAPANTDTQLGWERTKDCGGFDTGLAAHSVNETGRFKLEIQAASLLGTPRYDSDLSKWKADYCKALKMKADDLEGYGECPDDILYPYAAYDADVTRRLFDVYNGHPEQILYGKKEEKYKGLGLLDLDNYGLCSREAFWISMRASPGFLEMEQTGVVTDRKRGEELTELYESSCAKLLDDLRVKIKWDEFNPASDIHRKELLFGERYNGKVATDGSVGPIRVRPEGAISLGMRPIKSTSNKDWASIAARGDEYKHSASCDKESLSILAANDNTGIVADLRDVRFLGHVFHSTLRHPSMTSTNAVSEALRDDDGNLVFKGGLLSNICSDGRIRTHLYQTKETGRASSARPNLQNLGKKREADYQRILGGSYRYALRTMLSCAPGNVLIEADYGGAEVAGAAWMSDDPMLMKAVADPTFDMHSSIAVEAFQLDCEPSKAGLKKAGLGHLRNAAKAVIFGYFYGQGAESAARKAKEETGKDITVEDCRKLQERLEHKFPHLVAFFGNCRASVRSPGWMCNSFGRFRRFKRTDDKQAQGESERQAMNFPIQSMIADAVSRAIDNLTTYRTLNPDTQFKMILQIHDAILIEVPVEHAQRLWDEIIPLCMVKQVPIYPVTLEGVPTGKGPYYLDIGRDLYIRWGEEIYTDETEAFGLPSYMGVKRDVNSTNTPRIEEYAAHALRKRVAST